MSDEPQLKMNWPTDRLDRPLSKVDVPCGYQLRQASADDLESFIALMHACLWSDWDRSLLNFCMSRLIPNGWFIITMDDSVDIVASAMSLHNYTGRAPQSGTLGWVGCDPQHRGQRLGSIVSTAATTRLLEAGYHDVELYTEHFRLPAIRSYLRLGYVPYLYNKSVTETWQAVCEQLDWPFTPNQWPAGDHAFPNH